MQICDPDNANFLLLRSLLNGNCDISKAYIYTINVLYILQKTNSLENDHVMSSKT